MPAASRPGADPTVRILVAASDASVRRSLQARLEDEGFAVCSAAESGPSAIEAAFEHKPDVFLVSADLQGSALVAAATITNRIPQTRVVVVAQSPDEEDCLTYLLAGTSAYVAAENDGQSLASTVRRVVAGHAVVPAAVQRRLLEELSA